MLVLPSASGIYLGCTFYFWPLLLSLLFSLDMRRLGNRQGSLLADPSARHAIGPSTTDASSLLALDFLQKLTRPWASSTYIEQAA
jgi:hypothetical protein